MAQVQGTQTEKNLMLAFAGESQARNRYTYFASQAVKDGFMQIAAIFEETANQEKEHAKRFFKFLEGSEVEIQAKFPAGVIGTTLENLTAAAKGEYHEHSSMYPSFAQIARQEGFAEIAKVFDAVAIAETHHEERYKKLSEDIKNKTVFKKGKVIQWECRNCGYVHTGVQAPDECPACAHPQSYYQQKTNLL
ncbi:MAG: rubrerythrin family protein [bacterium]